MDKLRPDETSGAETEFGQPFQKRVLDANRPAEHAKSHQTNPGTCFL